MREERKDDGMFVQEQIRHNDGAIDVFSWR